MTARRIIAYGDNFIIFYKLQDKKVQENIEFVLDLVRFERKIPKRFFKYLEGSNGIYEIRVRTAFKDLRILCFLDKDDLIVLTNCFLKKTHKTPRNKINLAERLKREYMADKYETNRK